MFLCGRPIDAAAAPPDSLPATPLPSAPFRRRTSKIDPGRRLPRQPGSFAANRLPAWRNSIEAIEDSVVLEVSTPHLDDVVRLQDHYGRA